MLGTEIVYLLSARLKSGSRRGGAGLKQVQSTASAESASAFDSLPIWGSAGSSILALSCIVAFAVVREHWLSFFTASPSRFCMEGK